MVRSSRLGLIQERTQAQEAKRAGGDDGGDDGVAAGNFNQTQITCAHAPEQRYRSGGFASSLPCRDFRVTLCQDGVFFVFRELARR